VFASDIAWGEFWLLIEVISVVASGIKLGRCWLLMEVVSESDGFCLVAYFDVGPLFRPVVLFGCLFCCWSVVSSHCFVSLGCSDGSAMCCDFGHQARALLAADGSGERK